MPSINLPSVVILSVFPMTVLAPLLVFHQKFVDVVVDVVDDDDGDVVTVAAVLKMLSSKVRKVDEIELFFLKFTFKMVFYSLCHLLQL